MESRLSANSSNTLSLALTHTPHAHSGHHRIHSHIAHSHAHPASHRHHVVHTSSTSAHTTHIASSHGVVHHSTSVEPTVIIVHAHIALESSIIVVVIVPTSHRTGEVAVVLVVTTVGIITSTVEPTSSSTTITLIVRGIIILRVGRWIESSRAPSDRPLFSGTSGSVLGEGFEWVLHWVREDHIVLAGSSIGSSGLLNLVFCGRSCLRGGKLDVGLPRGCVSL